MEDEIHIYKVSGWKRFKKSLSDQWVSLKKSFKRKSQNKQSKPTKAEVKKEVVEKDTQKPQVKIKKEKPQKDIKIEKPKRKSMVSSEAVFTSVLGFAIITIIALGIYLTSKNEPAQSQQQKAAETPTPQVSTQDWEIYTNDEFGFSFQHPANWPEAKQTTVSTNAAPFYESITFGEYLTLNAKDERHSSPSTLSSLQDDESYTNVSTSDYFAFRQILYDGRVRTTLSGSLDSINIVSATYKPGVLDKTIYEAIISSFRFTE